MKKGKEKKKKRTKSDKAAKHNKLERNTGMEKGSQKGKKWEKTEADELIIKTFEKNKNIKKTASETGENVIRVRRVLITEGLWESKRSRQVRQMLEAGKNDKEIAEELGISFKTVQSLKPYNRGKRYEQNPETKDAVRSFNYRKRMKLAEKNQKRKIREENKTGCGHSDLMRVNLTLESGVNFFQSLDISDVDTSDYQELLSSVSILVSDEADFDPDYPDPSQMERVFKLRLRLDTKDAPLDLIHLYGKSQKDISREIVIPGCLPLSRFHYLIQRAFGWQDAHPHAFFLDDNELSSVTGGKLSGLLPLCGNLFAFAPAGEAPFREELSYEPTMSIRSWFKQLYQPPFDSSFFEEARRAQASAALSFIKYELPHTADSLSKKGIFTAAAPDDISIFDFKKYVPYAGELSDAATVSDVLAHTDSFSYLYDPDKDSWKVDIKMLASSNIFGTITPFCSASDGLCVMERVGGPNGYAKFLDDTKDLSNRNLNWIYALSEHGSMPKGNAGKLAAARDKGWTGNLIAPKNLI